MGGNWKRASVECDDDNLKKMGFVQTEGRTEKNRRFLMITVRTVDDNLMTFHVSFSAVVVATYLFGMPTIHTT